MHTDYLVLDKTTISKALTKEEIDVLNSLVIKVQKEEGYKSYTVYEDVK